ncbi:ABC transporter permease [Flavobacterium branchiophilum]|uniref:ABC transporter permease n=2 Tax=Flavobacterium branchiophilum TaxID=55197 RepID=A0A2H3KQC6_9FLAO|nr:FtsX-like permease family protein [Flavobacterium branchiophilum]OXA78372.1 ABC transporter permease [Flavobacterium branchiophilum] [Flavobacterium branchiophilum NBRC 15030 = ATCC 35035]PDS23782.1 ABC transporter permease [Flavobacterium branchiophilum]TQM41155.1 lipoprotein-releasing system permease protein [Flavobacterium branchiophilum]CCB68769.1 Probable ABC-type transport system, permease component [Flavobacterium branchiophilum FL-15]GEM56250.1 permease [Flavobacterium branchiophilu
MNLEYFIAQRLVSSKVHKNSISSPIIKIAVAAIAIGMVMMIVSIATGFGLQKKIQEKLVAFSGHIQISNFDDNQSQVSKKPISTHQHFYPHFKNIQGIQNIQGVATKAGIIRTDIAFEGVILKGVGPDYDWTFMKEYLVAGHIPDVTTHLNNDVLISQLLADKMNLKLNQSFQTFFMKENQDGLPNMRNFKIVGIYNSGFQEFDATYIIGNIKHIQRINHWENDQVGAFEIFINHFEDMEIIGNQVYKEIPPTLESKTINEKYANIIEWLKLFDFNIITILIIMILVASINMVVALLVLILEKTQMIGILKALGANNWTIRKIFLYNAFHLIVRGLCWGNGVAIGLLLLQQQFGIIKLNPENYYVNTAPVYLHWNYLIALNVGTIFICLLVLLIPSYIITKISPVKAIRFE